VERFSASRGEQGSRNRLQELMHAPLLFNHLGSIMIHKALRLTREFHRMKQVELAKKLSISTSYLSEIESGKKPASVETIGNYARVFGVPASTFFLFEEQVLPPLDERRKARASKLLQFFAWVVEEEADDDAGETEEVAEAGTAKKAISARSVRPVSAKGHGATY